MSGGLGMERRRGAQQHAGSRPAGSRVKAAALRPSREVERRQVADIQRARMLSAMTELARQHGVDGVTVAHVVARAGVSRRTFYELFEDREDCFLTALDQGLGQLATVVLPAYESQSGWSDRIRAGLTALLEFFDEEPGTAALCVVDALGAGPRALELRSRILDSVIAAVGQGRQEALPQELQVLNELTAEGAVGAVLGVLHARLQGRSHKPLSGLRGQLMSMIVLPYLGPREAAIELTRPAPAARRARHARRDPLKGLDMRLTYRTMRVLSAVAANPGLSNRGVAREAGVTDQGQISKLLQRLEHLGLIRNAGEGSGKGEPNAWTLTHKGEELEQAVRARAQH
jgi:AcrR family transcriptional regulator